MILYTYYYLISDNTTKWILSQDDTDIFFILITITIPIFRMNRECWEEEEAKEEEKS